MARPVEFEYNDVLTNAMEQFWREGFEASSVQKLLDVTGINRGTLYNSFGDKDTFFQSLPRPLQQAGCEGSGCISEQCRPGTLGCHRKVL